MGWRGHWPRGEKAQRSRWMRNAEKAPRVQPADGAQNAKPRANAEARGVAGARLWVLLSALMVAACSGSSPVVTDAGDVVVASPDRVIGVTVTPIAPTICP